MIATFMPEPASRRASDGPACPVPMMEKGLPSTKVLLVSRERAITLRNALWVAGFAVLGASQYLYLIYMSRVGGYVEVPVRTVPDLWDLLRGGEFKNLMWGFSLFDYLELRVPLLGEVVGAEYLFLQAPIAYGMWRGWRADRPHRDITIHLFLLGVLSTIFATNYNVFDVQVFFLPLLYVLAVFLGLGLEGIIRWAHANYPGHERIVWGVAAALVALPLITGVMDYRRSSQRGNFEDAQRIERAIDLAGSDAVLLTSNYEETQFVSYYLVVDHLAEQRNLAAVPRKGVSVKDVKRYLSGRGGQVEQAAGQLEDVAQPGLFVPEKGLATALDEAGVEVEQVDTSVWQVLYPDNWKPRRRPTAVTVDRSPGTFDSSDTARV